MTEPTLSDPKQFPTTKIIRAAIGKSFVLWDSLFDHIKENHPEVVVEWRYYNDGKQWLMKVTRKKKTLFWLSIVKPFFRLTFYFTKRANKEIRRSGISDKLKDQFKNAKSINHIRGIRVVVKRRRDLHDAQELLALRIRFK